MKNNWSFNITVEHASITMLANKYRVDLMLKACSEVRDYLYNRAPFSSLSPAAFMIAEERGVFGTAPQVHDDALREYFDDVLSDGNRGSLLLKQTCDDLACNGSFEEETGVFVFEGHDGDTLRMKWSVADDAFVEA